MNSRGSIRPWLEKALSHESDDCLLYPFGKFADGYGAVWIDGKQVKAHRWICMRAHGSAPTALHHAAHSCGNRACVNHRHLRWATRKENEADKIPQGRSNRGDRHGRSRLTIWGVMMIRGHSGSQRELARRLGVAESTISSVKHRRSWAWL